MRSRKNCAYSGRPPRMAVAVNAPASSRNTCPYFGLAKTAVVCQDGIEERMRVHPARTISAQHIGRCGPLLKRFGELLRPLPEFVEQPRVLDGDDGLGCEVLDQLDLLVGERANFLTEDRDDANEFIFIAASARLEHCDNRRARRQ